MLDGIAIVNGGLSTFSLVYQSVSKIGLSIPHPSLLVIDGTVPGFFVGFHGSTRSSQPEPFDGYTVRGGFNFDAGKAPDSFADLLCLNSLIRVNYDNRSNLLGFPLRFASEGNTQGRCPGNPSSPLTPCLEN